MHNLYEEQFLKQNSNHVQCEKYLKKVKIMHLQNIVDIYFV